MPYFGIKLHLWRFERVVLRNLDIDHKSTSLVASIFGPKNLAFPMVKVLPEHLCLDDQLFILVGYALGQIFDFLHQTILSHITG